MSGYQTDFRKLKRVVEEIRAIMSRENLMAGVVLADGLGGSEFAVMLTEQSWSQLRWINRADGSVAIHSKLHMKSKPVETQRTTNAVFNLTESMGRTSLMLYKVTDQWESVVKIEKEELRDISSETKDLSP